MKIESFSINALKRYAPQLETFTAFEKIMLVILFIFWFAGVPALIIQHLEGHIVTGMRDNVVWGVYIVNFIFYIGISYAGALISGILFFHPGMGKSSLESISMILSSREFCVSMVMWISRGMSSRGS